MPNELDPIVGQWYLHRDKGQMFRVVAADLSTACIEIQHFDGDVEELEADAWRELDIEPAEAPEDWTGPYDDVEPDDLGLSESAMTPAEWRRSLESARAPQEEAVAQPESEEPEDAADEESERPAEPYLEDEEAARKRTQ